jgi:NAD(P)-dependent dehydrogenase (short-subunit alcohol dehydrogenase family)
MPRSPEELAGVADVDCFGQQALVTGSTSGIGREAALALGRLGADVIVHGRDETAGEAVVDELEALDTDGRFVKADFASVDDVRELAETVRTDTDGLDILINNAGGLFREGQLSALGVEYTFHVNHLSPFLLTTELLGHLDDDARIVTTASAAHQGTALNLNRVTSVDRYTSWWAYSHSKLANILFASELAHRLDGTDRAITSNSIHPGAIPGSGFSRFLPRPLPQLVGGLSAVPGVTTVADGAAELLFPAVSPRTADISGRYFRDQQPTTPSSAARDRDNAQRLWAFSADVLDIEEPLEALAT